MKDGIKEILESGQFPGVTGTRDGFGIGKAFFDAKTHKEIDNWKTWEREGYMNPSKDHLLPHDAKEAIKRKVEKIKKYDTGAKKHFVMGG